MFYVVFSGQVKVYVDTITNPGSAPLSTCVGVLEDGDSFGELALLGDGIRNATVTTSVVTRLLTIEKAAYETSLMRLHETELSARMVALRRVFLFSEWDDADLRR
jgi:CRP-like cAMP-binding protein